MKFMLKYPWLAVVLVGLVTVFFAFQLPRVKLDNDVAHFIPLESPARLAYQKVEDQFGAQMVIVVGLQAESGTVFTPSFLSTMKTLTDGIEQIAYVDSLTSLMTSDYIEGRGGDILTQPLVSPDFSGSQEEIDELKAKIQSWDLYENTLVSRDFSAAQIIVSIAAGLPEAPHTREGSPPLDDPKMVVYDGIKALLHEIDMTGIQSFVSGTPAFSILLSRNMQTDLRVLIPLVVLVVILSLYFSFRRLAGVWLPLITVLISTIWTVGLMGMLEVPLSLLGTIIPVIMIAVGSAYGIHVIQHYFDEASREEGVLSPQRIRELVAETLKKVGKPVLLAGLTTLAGFASLSLTTIIPMQVFGIFSSFGVLAALVVSLTFIPSLLILIPLKKGKTTEKRASFDKKLVWFFLGVTRRKGLMITATLALALLSVWGLSRLVVDNALVEYFKPHTEIARADEFLSTQFNGTKTFSLVVTGPEKGSLTDPRILKAMDDLAQHLQNKIPGVGKISSYTQLIKRINQVFNVGESAEGLKKRAESSASLVETPPLGFGDFGNFGEPLPEEPAEAVPEEEEPAPALDLELLNRALSQFPGSNPTPREWLAALNRLTNYQGLAYYEIPVDPWKYGVETTEDLKGIIANYLVLISSNTSSWADSGLEPSMARMMIQLNTKGNLATQEIMDEAQEFARLRFPPGYTLEGAGTALIEKALTDLIVESQVVSILFSLAMVFLILAVYFQSFTAGLVGIVPLSLAILINFGIMGLLGIKLDMSTAMIASLAIGIGIDYTIHYLSAYHHERLRSPDLKKVQVNTLLSSGKAILFNAVSVGAGFAVLIGSQFNPLMYIGMLIALTMATTSLSSMVLLPVLLGFFKPRFLTKELFFEREKPPAVVLEP